MEKQKMTETLLALGGPYLMFEISECGKTLDEVIAAVEHDFPGWRFSGTVPMYASCIMAVFEKG